MYLKVLFFQMRVLCFVCNSGNVRIPWFRFNGFPSRNYTSVELVKDKVNTMRPETSFFGKRLFLLKSWFRGKFLTNVHVKIGMEKWEKVLLAPSIMRRSGGKCCQKAEQKNILINSSVATLNRLRSLCLSVPLVSRSPTARWHGSDRWPSGIRRGVAPGVFRVPRMQGDTGRPHILLQGRAIVLRPTPRRDAEAQVFGLRRGKSRSELTKTGPKHDLGRTMAYL